MVVVFDYTESIFLYNYVALRVTVSVWKAFWFVSNAQKLLGGNISNINSGDCLNQVRPVFCKQNLYSMSNL